ncbi:endonuclease/exonuclease/phosphatase family protein [Streptomyces sp. NPDC020965]|uniref:endonuclease/exonuclease/phosphatase family protein n=1 Tax=Streptomyces sp. NPDC020965 TaxID=3365105 RepID=UPI00378A2C6D
MTWNPYGGGVDDDGSGRRLRAQAGILARLAPDVLALQECTHLPVVLDTDAKESS